MKKKIITITIVAFLGIFAIISLNNVKPKEIENAPDWQTIDVALEQVTNTEKLILVDVYEVGCKFCRAMERNVYPDPSVRAVIDRDYIPVKLNGNAEDLVTVNGATMSSQDYAQSFGVFVFPTTLILDANGDLIKKKTGYMGVDELRRFLYKTES